MNKVFKGFTAAFLAGAMMTAVGLPEMAETVITNHSSGSKVTISESITSYAAPKSQKAKKKAAKKLIGKLCTRKYIEKKVGKPKKFVMSNAGCERGVYAGNFYYKGFMIHSRTYNKGKTFRVVAVN